MTLHDITTMTARTIAPEDLRAGVYVAVASLIDEWVVRSSECMAEKPGVFVARVRLLPVTDIVPLKVKSVCLPFVLATSPSERATMLDVRQHELVELSEVFARKAMKALRTKGGKGGDGVGA